MAKAERGKGFAFFWGCHIQARFVFMEKSTRLVMDELRIPYQDLDGFTCCPEESLAKNFDAGLWELAATRNVALAEKHGLDLMSACNGCYSTLRGMAQHLKAHPLRAQELNRYLEEVGLEFSGKAKVRHFVEYLHDIYGLRKLQAHVRYPLGGLRVAVHPGCHLLRPSSHIHFDDPMKPKKYDALVEALGARALDYPAKMVCCGGSLDRVAQHEKALEMAALKIRTLTDLGADCITTTCPSCFQQYDNNQFLLRRKGLEFNLPVLTLQELMGLSFGIEPEAMGLDFHRVSAGPLLEKLRKLAQGVPYAKAI